jgi:D-xylose transport system permease protein
MDTASDTGLVVERRGIGGLVDALELDTRLVAMLAALAVIWVGFDLITGGIFLTPRNLWNLSVQTSVVGILATGMVLVIVARHIDLSVGSVLGFLSMVVAVLQVQYFPLGASWNWIATVACGLVLGFCIGSFQGWWIAYRGVPAFIVTLGGLLVFRGLAWWVTYGTTVAPLDQTFQLLGGGINGSIGATWTWVVGLAGIAAMALRTVTRRRRRAGMGFPVRALWAEITVLLVLSAAIVGFVLVMNAYMRPRTDQPQGIPIRGNPEAALLAGINVRRITLLIFALVGVLAGIAGAVQTARLNAGASSTGELLELSVIAAAVIGGTSLGGGAGTISGAVLGALIMQSLQSGMVLVALPTPMQNIVIGGVLVVAVWLDNVYQRRRR